jgi:DNA-binding IclR family transcriptional regulator
LNRRGAAITGLRRIARQSPRNPREKLERCAGYPLTQKCTGVYRSSMTNQGSTIPNSAPGRKRSGLNSGLDILEIIAAGTVPLSLTVIAQRIGLSKSSVHTLLSTLHERGYVRRLDDQRYTIGIRAWQVGCVATPIEMSRIAGPHMTELVGKVHDGAAMAVLDGCETVCVQLVESTQAVRVHDNIGNRCPAWCVSNGVSMLATMADEDVLRLLPAELPRPTDHSFGTHAQVLAKLREVRQTGYTVMRRAWRPDTSGISVPVRGPDDRMVAALCVSMPAFRATEEHLAHTLVHLRRAALEIEREFGVTRPELSLFADSSREARMAT